MPKVAAVSNMSSAVPRSLPSPVLVSEKSTSRRDACSYLREAVDKVRKDTDDALKGLREGLIDLSDLDI